MAPDLHCIDPKIGNLLPQFELDRLPDSGKFDFEEHLLFCDFCRHELLAMRPVISVMATERQQILAGLKQEGLSYDTIRADLFGEPEPPVTRPKFEDASIFAKLMDWLRQPVVWGPATALALGFIALLMLNPGAKSGRYEPLLAFKLQPYGGIITRGAGDPDEQEFALGIEAYEAADPGKAIPHLKKATELNRTYAEAWLYLGISQFVKKDAKAAVVSLTQAVSLQSGDELANAKWYLAQAHLLTGDRERAEPILNELSAVPGPHTGEAAALLAKLSTMK